MYGWSRLTIYGALTAVFGGGYLIASELAQTPSSQPQGKSITVKVIDATPKPTFEIRDFAVSGSPERGYRAVARIVTTDRNVSHVTVFYELKSSRTREIRKGTLEYSRCKTARQTWSLIAVSIPAS